MENKAEHGEVCPANWTEGEKTIKASPKESLEYFSAVNGEEVMNERAKKRGRNE